MEPFRLLMAVITDKNVASVAATSFASVRQISRSIDFRRPLTLVEYGPGTGAFTRYLLKRLHPDSTLVAIELNRELAIRLRRFARRRLFKRPRLAVVRGDALNVHRILKTHGCGPADYVLSGIPFSFLPEDPKREIIRQTFHVLAPGGCFLLYQITFHVRPYVEAVFGTVKCSRALLNVPPLCVMQVRKPAPLAVGTELGRQGPKPTVLIDAGQR